MTGEQEIRAVDSSLDGEEDRTKEPVSANASVSDEARENTKPEGGTPEELLDPHETRVQSQDDSPELDLTAGDRVCLIVRPPYFKTADPMTMLRPPDIVPVGENGTIIDRRPGGYWAVRFPQGSFLIEPPHIRKTSHLAS